MEYTTPPKRQDKHSVSKLEKRTEFTQAPTHMAINLFLTQHTLEEIDRPHRYTNNSPMHQSIHLLSRSIDQDDTSVLTPNPHKRE